MCHALLCSPPFFALLGRIDHELAELARAARCACGGALHRADYPRKPRGAAAQVRSEHTTRLSFCCAVCRRRTTPASVRFLGQRVYLALAVVLRSDRRAGPSAAAAQLQQQLEVPLRTLQRWQSWWSAEFPMTALWRAAAARFMPPLAAQELPGALVDRFVAGFVGASHEAMTRMLVFLSPLTVRAERALGAAP